MTEYSGRYTAQGPGGRFVGGGAMAGGGGEDVVINISVVAYDLASPVLKSVGDGIQQNITTINQGTKSSEDFSKSNKESAEAIREQIAPIRSVSWDMLLMGRSLSILNNTFFNHNQILRDITGVIYGVGAAMRVVVTIADIERVLLGEGIIQHGIITGLLYSKAKAYDTVAASAGRAAAAESASAGAGMAGGMGLGLAGLGGIPGIGLLALGGALIAGIIWQQTQRRSYQYGGVIPETGIYMLHQGEKVIPANSQGSMQYNNITINFQSGPISSQVDVDRMLDNMALRMAQESRRRIG